MNVRELKAKLEQAGFIQKGGTKHDKFVHPDGRITVVHRHKGDIPLGTLKNIEKQTGIRLI
jgi:predicted RNA binding protein YcfA (HicA-like mRNA interferase family)